MNRDELRQKWIEERAYALWREAGSPQGRDLEFWLEAEWEHDQAWKGQLCVLSPGRCPYQTEQPTTGGGHVALCTRPDDRCRYLAAQLNKAANVKEMTRRMNLCEEPAQPVLEDNPLTDEDTRREFEKQPAAQEQGRQVASGEAVPRHPEEGGARTESAADGSPLALGSAHEGGCSDG
jgi:hypothetical protein